MKTKVLVAVDCSGSTDQNKARKAVLDTLKTICPDATIDFGAFDHKWQGLSSMKDFLDGGNIYGGGSDLTEVLEVAEDYDHTFIITDGYISGLDKLPVSVSAVAYEFQYS